jgi:hypothetical protein
MPHDQRLAVATAFWRDQDSALQHEEAVQAIAKQFKFRPQSVKKLPLERRARQLAALPRPSDSIASRALIAYHLSTRRPMLEAFLDSLGITHEQGVVAEVALTAPPPAKLASAAGELAKAFPPEEVRLYLLTLAAQDPDVWGGLVQVVREHLPA